MQTNKIKNKGIKECTKPIKIQFAIRQNVKKYEKSSSQTKLFFR